MTMGWNVFKERKKSKGYKEAAGKPKSKPGPNSSFGGIVNKDKVLPNVLFHGHYGMGHLYPICPVYFQGYYGMGHLGRYPMYLVFTSDTK